MTIKSGQTQVLEDIYQGNAAITAQAHLTQTRIPTHIIDMDQRKIQYLDVKQMMEILIRYRAQLKTAIKTYRHWQDEYAQEKDDIEKPYKAYEGIFIRRQCQDAWSLYRAVNKDYHAMCRRYLSSLERYPHTHKGAA